MDRSRVAEGRERVIGLTYDVMDAYIRATPEDRQRVHDVLLSTGLSWDEVTESSRLISDAMRQTL